MKIKKIWFDDEYLYGLGDNGTTYRQSQSIIYLIIYC